MRCWWHKWTKWESYIESGHKILGVPWGDLTKRPVVQYQEEHQRRHCVKCGKVQDECV